MESYCICPFVHIWILHCHCLEILNNFRTRAPPVSFCTGPLTSYVASPSVNNCNCLRLLHTKIISMSFWAWLKFHLFYEMNNRWYSPLHSLECLYLLTVGTLHIVLWSFLLKSVFPARGNVLLIPISFMPGVTPELCPVPKCICRSPNPQYDNIWRWGPWEVIRFRWSRGRGLLHSWWEYYPYEKRNQRACPCSFCCVKTHSESGHMQVRKRVLIRNWPCQHPNLRLPVSRKCEKINFCCLSHLLHDIFLWKLKQTKTIWYKLSALICSPNIRMAACSHSGSQLALL